MAPLVERQWTLQDSTGNPVQPDLCLRIHGPALSVEVGVPDAFADRQLEKGIPAPPPVAGLALLGRDFLPDKFVGYFGPSGRWLLAQ